MKEDTKEISDANLAFWVTDLLAEADLIRQEADFRVWKNKAKEILFTDTFGFGFLHRFNGRIKSFQPISRYEEIPHYDEQYGRLKLFLSDPLILEIMEQIDRNQREVTSWSACYERWAGRKFHEWLSDRRYLHLLETYDGYLYCRPVTEACTAILSLGGEQTVTHPEIKKAMIILLPTLIALYHTIPLGPLKELTMRQFHIFQLSATGMKQAEVSAALGISLQSVNFHGAKIRKKTGLKKTSHFAYWGDFRDHREEP